MKISRIVVATTGLAVAAGLLAAQLAGVFGGQAEQADAPAAHTATPVRYKPVSALPQRVVITPFQASGSIVAAGDDRLTLTDGDTGRGQFVLDRAGDRYRIRTGQASCAVLAEAGPVTVAPCGKSLDQQFTIARLYQNDQAGHPTYAIGNHGMFLTVSPEDGLIAAPVGPDGIRPAFVLADVPVGHGP